MYTYIFVAIYATHPMWGFPLSWNNAVGRWALRLQGHGWAAVSGDVRVLVRTCRGSTDSADLARTRVAHP